MIAALSLSDSFFELPEDFCRQRLTLAATNHLPS